MRVAGTNVRGDDLPWWCVPAWLGVQLPLLTLVAVVGGLVVLVADFVRRRWLVGAGPTIARVPVVLQAVVLPAGPTVTGGHAGLYVFIRWSRAADFRCTVVLPVERDGHLLGEGARCPAPASR